MLTSAALTRSSATPGPASAATSRALLLLTVCLCLVSLSVRAQSESSGLRQEYFLQQGPNEELLIRINGFESDFEARVYGPERELIALSGVPGARLSPLFIYLDGRSSGRQLNIEVIANNTTARSRFDLELSRMNIHDERSARLARAYEMLAFGLSVPPDDAPATWSVMINNLFNASRVFEQFGMEQLRLWSEYYSALLMLRELGDNYGALDIVSKIIEDPGGRRHPEVILAARLLEIEALGLLRAGGELPPEAGAEDVLQVSASMGAAMALRMDQDYARAWVLNESARDYANRGLQALALEQFQEALDIADQVGAGELATSVREALVDIHGSQGDVLASAEVLRAIESQLSEDGGGDDLAQNLLEQGQLFNQAHDYESAIEVLQRALEFERNSLTRDQVRLELAIAFFELGQLDEALEQSAAVVLNANTGAWRQRTPVLDVARGIGILAGVYRARGNFEAMSRARSAQRERLTGELVDAWEYQLAQDYLATGNSASAAAEVLATLARRGTSNWSRLADLQLCALNMACNPAQARSGLIRLSSLPFGPVPAEAQLLNAMWQRRSASVAVAAQAAEEMMEQVMRARQQQTGSLGAWYWQRLDDLVSTYLQPQLVSASAEQALLAVARARHLMSQSVRNSPQSQPGKGAIPTLGDLRSLLTGIGRNQALLDAYVDASGGWVFLVDASGVRRWQLAEGVRLKESLEVAARQLPVLNGAGFDQLMDRLGEQLLGPLPKQLPAHLYWMVGDALAGISPAALRRGGRYLVQDHSLTGLPGFPRSGLPSGAMPPGWQQAVFLAGRPQDYSGEYLDRLEISAELRAAADPFVGPGLTVVQGAALLPDEFEVASFSSAGLVHLAMPGALNIRRPSASYLQLSEPVRGEGRLQMGIASVSRWTLNAGLVVLSQSRLVLPDAARKGHRIPLVSQLLDVGAVQVIATLWANDDQQSARFISQFYSALKDINNPAMALALAQRAAIDRDADSRDWARYQLYSQ